MRRHKPRDFVEWQTLRRWERLPPWEEDPPGYLLRETRERSGLTQRELAERLSCSQQAIAQAERWESNPTIAFMRQWCRALGLRLRIDLHEVDLREAEP